MFLLKLSGIQNQLPTTFGTSLICIKILNVINPFPLARILTFDILLHIKSEPKVIQTNLGVGDDF